MLRSITSLKGFTIQATDGEIGKVEELFFDERSWRVRYLVIDIGSWLIGRQLLIVPSAVAGIDVETKHLSLYLTKDQIEHSPEVSADEPISREQERSLHDYYQWQPYWAGGIYDPMIYGVYPAALAQKPAEQQKETGTAPDSTLRSTAEVRGYHIQASDGQLGQVTDFLFDDEAWIVRQLVVDTGNWLPGHKVLIAPPWIADIRWPERKVTVTLTQESVRKSPLLGPELINSENYEERLLALYEDWYAYLLEKEEQAVDEKQAEAPVPH